MSMRQAMLRSKQDEEDKVRAAKAAEEAARPSAPAPKKKVVPKKKAVKRKAPAAKKKPAAKKAPAQFDAFVGVLRMVS